MVSSKSSKTFNSEFRTTFFANDTSDQNFYEVVKTAASMNQVVH